MVTHSLLITQAINMSTILELHGFILFKNDMFEHIRAMVNWFSLQAIYKPNIAGRPSDRLWTAMCFKPIYLEDSDDGDIEMEDVEVQHMEIP